MFASWDECVFNGNLTQIRPLKKSDMASLQKGFSPNLFEYYPWTFKSCEDFVLNRLNEKEKQLYFPWVIVEKSTGECIGSSSFSNISIAHKRLEIGFTWISKEKQKLGFNVRAFA